LRRRARGARSRGTKARGRFGLRGNGPRSVPSPGGSGGLSRPTVSKRHVRLRILERLRPRALPGTLRGRDRTHVEAQRRVRVARGAVATR